ncbi:MAG: RNA polymerase sigma factor [Enhygromyxa sp.]
MTTNRWAIDASTGTIVRLGAELRGYFRSKLRDTREAEDCVHNTWISANRTFEGRCPLRDYLYIIAKRMVFDYWRRKARRRGFYMDPLNPDELHAEGPDLDDVLSNRADIDRLRRAVEEIPEPFQEPVQLALRGYGFVEMAEMMNINYNTVRSRFARGKRHLEGLLESDPSFEKGFE